MDITNLFMSHRFNEAMHLGLGDIRLTIGEQDEIIENIATVKEYLTVALDALWELHGNGWQTEYEKPIAALQRAIDRL